MTLYHQPHLYRRHLLLIPQLHLFKIRIDNCMQFTCIGLFILFIFCGHILPIHDVAIEILYTVGEHAIVFLYGQRGIYSIVIFSVVIKIKLHFAANNS